MAPINKKWCFDLIGNNLAFDVTIYKTNLYKTSHFLQCIWLQEASKVKKKNAV